MEDERNPSLAVKIACLIVAVICFAAVPLVFVAQLVRASRLFD